MLNFIIQLIARKHLARYEERLRAIAVDLEDVRKELQDTKDGHEALYREAIQAAAAELRRNLEARTEREAADRRAREKQDAIIGQELSMLRAQKDQVDMLASYLGSHQSLMAALQVLDHESAPQAAIRLIQALVRARTAWNFRSR